MQVVNYDIDRLVSLGYRGLTAEQYGRLLQEQYDTTGEIVGMKIASRMTDTQLDEFEHFIDAGEDKAALKWLEENMPDYKDVVYETVDQVDRALRQAALEASDPIRATNGGGRPPGEPPDATAS